MPGTRDEEIATALKGAYEAGRLAVWFDRPFPRQGQEGRTVPAEKHRTADPPPEWHH